MTEIRDTFRGSEDAEIERRGGKGMGRGYPHPYPLAIRLWGLWGSILSSPSGVWG